MWCGITKKWTNIFPLNLKYMYVLIITFKNVFKYTFQGTNILIY